MKKRRMNLSNKTILITGGSSGIGLKLAEKLLEKGNTVIICGRSEERLEKVKTQLPQIKYIQCDLAIQKERELLYNRLVDSYPSVDVLVNNAAYASRFNILKEEAYIEKTENEIQTNLIAPIALTKMFLPKLINNNGLIVNVTTGLAYVPKAQMAVYCAGKAALHSFTQSIRYQLMGESIKLVEVLMPAVKTPFHNGEIPKISIDTETAVDEMIKGIEKEKPEVRVDKVKLLYRMSRLAPAFAFRKVNQL